MNEDFLTLAKVTTKLLDQYLIENQLSLGSFSKAANIPISTLKNLYHAHTKSPTLALIFKISAGMNIEPWQFLQNEAFYNESLELE